MKRLISASNVLLFLGFIAFSAFKSDATGISFEHLTWEETLKKGETENKLIFIDAYTSWCGPCKYMASTTFQDQSVGDFFNKNFVNAKFDMEKGEGPMIASKYGVNAYPTLLIVDSKGVLVGRTMGYQNSEQLLTFARQYVAGSN